MKVLFQFLVILAYAFAGEVLHALIPLPVPASVYGLVLLFVSLLTGAVKLPQVEEAADFMLQIMPALFIAAAAGLLTIAGQLWENLLPLLTAVFVSTVVVMVVTGHVAQWMIRRKERQVDRHE